MLDYHLIHALQAMIPKYTASFANFAALFDGENVTTAVLTEWWNRLVAAPPEVREFAAKSASNYPALVVQLQNEGAADAPMGSGYTTNAGVKVEQQDVSTSAAIEIWAGTPEMVRVFHVLVRAIVLGVRPNFQRAGYTQFNYAGVDPPTAVEEQIAEDFGVLVRRVSVSATRRVAVPQLGEAGATVSWFVLASDESIAGVNGGVVPFQP